MASFAILSAMSLTGRANTTAPVIFNSTESVKPGQVLGIQGENFGTSPQVWLQVVTTSATPTPQTQITNVLTSSSQYVAVELPPSLQMGLYAIFVKNTNTNVTSAYKFVNRARGLGFLDLADTAVRPSQTFRIYGRNLDFSGSTTTVKFRNTSTLAITNATVTQGSDPFILTVTSPSGVAAGQSYDILINNGYGSTNGDVVSTTTLAGRATGTDYWNLGVTWGSSAYPYSPNVYNIKTGARTAGLPALTSLALGDGSTNDSAAIQAAITLASTATVNGVQGAVIYFPAGTYNVDGASILMKSNVILQGAGKTLSKIYDNSGLRTDSSLFRSSSDTDNIGVADLAIECGPNGNNSTWKVGGASSNCQFLLRSRFVNNHKEVLVYGSHNMLVDGCEVVHLAPTGKNVIDFTNRFHFIIRNSTIQWTDGRIDMLNGANDIQLENNVWSRSVNTASGGLGYGGPSFATARDVVILNNTFNKLEAGSTRLPGANDGETLLNENSGYKEIGHATAGTDTTITDSTKAFTTNAYANYEVAIVQGKGMGQSRKIASNTATTLTLTSAWEVNPDATSYYSIVKFDSNYLCKGNLLQDVPRGIWLTYAGSMRDVAIVGNSLIDGQGIYLRGDHRSYEHRMNVQNNILVEGNTLQNTKNWYPAQIVIQTCFIAGAELTGTPFYNVVVRDNAISAPVTGGIPNPDAGSGERDGYYCRQTNRTDNDTAGILGVIFDHNTSTNLPTAYTVNAGSYQTVIFNSINNNVGVFVSDKTMGANGDTLPTTHASVGTYVGWTSAAVTPPYVSVTATDAIAIESNGSTGNFRISRTGTSGALTVIYAKAGATAGDYTQTFGGSVTIPSGASFVDLPVTPVSDGVTEGKEPFTISITSNGAYQVGNPSATVAIYDQPEFIVDDADPTGVTLFGDWPASSTTAGYYGAGYLTDDNLAKGTKSVRFAPTLEQAGSYEVYARWTSSSNRADNVPVDINYAGGVDHVQVNQKLTGGTWVLLGTYSFNAGSTGNVELFNAGTNGYVVADAVRFLQTQPPPELILDNTDTTGVTKVGTWTTATATPGYYGSNYLHDGNTGQGTKSVRYTPTITVPGTYQVYARWTSFSNRATNVPIDITHAGGTAHVSVDQTANGGAWVLLGTYTFNTGTAGNVLISNTGTNGYVVADAVRFLGQ